MFTDSLTVPTQPMSLRASEDALAAAATRRAARPAARRVGRRVALDLASAHVTASTAAALRRPEMTATLPRVAMTATRRRRAEMIATAEAAMTATVARRPRARRPTLPPLPRCTVREEEEEEAMVAEEATVEEVCVFFLPLFLCESFGLTTVDIIASYDSYYGGGLPDR